MAECESGGTGLKEDRRLYPRIYFSMGKRNGCMLVFCSMFVPLSLILTHVGSWTIIWCEQYARQRGTILHGHCGHKYQHRRGGKRCAVRLERRLARQERRGCGASILPLSNAILESRN